MYPYDQYYAYIITVMWITAGLSIFTLGVMVRMVYLNNPSLYNLSIITLIQAVLWFIW